ncbi:MAG: chloride channel protein [Parapedobacter sp.]|nr:MAG: chloride channel protein [Parapedobacter sp.]
MKGRHLKNSIPISPTLDDFNASGKVNRKIGFSFPAARLVWICLLAVGIGATVSLIARILILFINLVTNLSFFGDFSLTFQDPAYNHRGLWVLIIPALGGLAVGLMALYGSKAIRGHGIPEAMEQILVNQSRIRPKTTLLKPISSAIAIGTGGPFGAEGPIIATGGAFGSTLGQFLRVTPRERKALLAAGATAGMSAIFGTPVAAIFLAVELLLFEFSARTILPVALACITGAAGHYFLFEAGPVFPMPFLSIPSNSALLIYSLIGVLIGVISVALTKAVYYVEDLFEKLPVHWMWWPALGGLAVGLIGYFAPYTFGVGYQNITNVLAGSTPLALLLSLALLKFASWCIALGSGTSGGTLAPLLTIGGACGAIGGFAFSSVFPDINISLSMAALIGMAAMFAGASRAYLTSILFALEATSQSNALVPLLAACTGSYLVSMFFMKNTIMTEKIARRGVSTPEVYEPDLLRQIAVQRVMKHLLIVPDAAQKTIGAIREFYRNSRAEHDFLAFVDQDGEFMGILPTPEIFNVDINPEVSVASVAKRGIYTIPASSHLGEAAELLAKSPSPFLLVTSDAPQGKITGIITYKEILGCYLRHTRDNRERKRSLLPGRQRIRILVKGRLPRTSDY